MEAAQGLGVHIAGGPAGIPPGVQGGTPAHERLRALGRMGWRGLLPAAPNRGLQGGHGQQQPLTHLLPRYTCTAPPLGVTLGLPPSSEGTGCSQPHLNVSGSWPRPEGVPTCIAPLQVVWASQAHRSSRRRAGRATLSPAQAGRGAPPGRVRLAGACDGCRG